VRYEAPTPLERLGRDGRELYERARERLGWKGLAALASLPVLWLGFCGARGAVCGASEGCLERGTCAGKGFGCVVGDEDDCKRSRRCKQAGHCTLRGGVVCVIGSEEDCWQSVGCKKQNLCTYRGGECLDRAPSCLDTEVCKDVGFCTSREGRCVAASDHDCRRSRLCNEFGQCRALEGRCVK
jgi:hypothetical protein